MYGKAKKIMEFSDRTFHDLANLLQGVIGEAELLKIYLQKADISAELKESIIERLELIAGNGFRASENIHEARDYLRTEEKEARRRIIYSPEQFLGYFPSNIAPRAVSFGLEYHLGRFEIEREKISIDESGLFNLIMNLFQNSSHAKAKNFWQEIWNDKKFVFMSFKDDGEGMTEETRQKCLQKGFTTKPKGIGTGLGLSNLAEYAHDNRGYAAVESESGKGAKIILALSKEVCYPTG
jgi:signal transduction histidine kinase